MLNGVKHLFYLEKRFFVSLRMTKMNILTTFFNEIILSGI